MIRCLAGLAVILFLTQSAMLVWLPGPHPEVADLWSGLWWFQMFGAMMCFILLVVKTPIGVWRALGGDVMREVDNGSGDDAFSSYTSSAPSFFSRRPVSDNYFSPPGTLRGDSSYRQYGWRSNGNGNGKERGGQNPGVVNEDEVSTSGRGNEGKTNAQEHSTSYLPQWLDESAYKEDLLGWSLTRILTTAVVLFVAGESLTLLALVYS